MPIDVQINTSDSQTDRVADDASKAASSFSMLELHLQNPSQKLDLGFDPIFGAIRPIDEHRLPFIEELSTVSDFDEGEFRKSQESYFIFREDTDTRTTPFDGKTNLQIRKASGRERKGEE